MQNEPRTVPVRRRVYNRLLILCMVLFQILLLMMAFTLGFYVNAFNGSGSLSIPSIELLQPQARYPILDEVSRLLKENAYFTLPGDKQLEYGMIKGMLAEAEDPYTVFVEPPQHELQTNQLQGRFGGIGARLEQDEEKNYYVYPLPDSPASLAGMKEGDRLLSVDNLVLTPETSRDDLEAAIRGPVGQRVKIVVGRPPDFEPISFNLERAEVPLPSVTWNLAVDQPSVGIIHVQMIANTTPEEVTEAWEDLESRGAERLVLDVRNNGGGLVDAGVNTARLFLKSGKIIEQQYRGKEIKTYTVEKSGPFSDIPMVVLINGGTASAAEILTGALQGQDRALVVGTHSYGKDTIQLVFSLSDGSSLHVTSAKWWVPGLENEIGGNGIQPDVLIPEDADDTQAQQAAIEAVMQLK